MGQPLKHYNNPEALYRGLANQEQGAIVLLHRQISGWLRSWRQSRQLAAADLEEIAEDAVIIVLQKIETGAYRFEGTDPAAYASVTTKNLLRNFMRKRQPATLEVQEWDAAEDPAVEQYLYHKEVERFIEAALAKMSDNCRQLITLFHLENKSDEEVLREGLTGYTSVPSLRSTRGECMKKLKQLAQALREHW